MKKKLHYNLGDLQEVVRQLSHTAHIWVPQMFPFGKRNGQDWRVGDLDGTRGMSTSIRLTGEKAGCFIDHANADLIGGGPIELIKLTYNLTFPQAIEKALEIARIPMPKYSEATEDKKAQEERDLSRVHRLYAKSRTIDGSLVQKYLKGRGLDINEIRCDALAFHPQLPHWQLKTNFPAMLGAVRDLSGGLVGIHRTYLDGVTHKKADIKPNKMMLGNITGGSVQLYKASQKVGVAEGIESAMAAHKIFRMPVWAALSTSGMANIQFPGTIKEVVIFVDNDEPGISAGIKLEQRLKQQGIVTSVAIPAKPGWDFNDQLLNMGK